MGNHIRHFREQKGWTQAQLAAAADTSQPQIDRLEKSDRQLTEKWMRRLAAALDVKPYELMELPDGVTLGPSDDHRVVPRSVAPPGLNLGEIAELDVRAGMGLGGESALEQFSPNGRDNHARELAVGIWRMPDDYLSTEIRTSPQFARMIAVEGDSMAPTLQSGDRVLVDTRRRVPSPPGVFAIWDGLGVVVKRIELIQGSDPPTVRIISDNAMHAPYERTAEEAAIIGRVVWFGRRL